MDYCKKKQIFAASLGIGGVLIFIASPKYRPFLEKGMEAVYKNWVLCRKHRMI